MVKSMKEDNIKSGYLSYHIYKRKKDKVKRCGVAIVQIWETNKKQFKYLFL
jgi:hypothetical protein